MKSSPERAALRTVVIICALLFGTVAVTYWPATRNGFVNLDDPAFVYSNPYVLQGLSWQSIRWAFTTMDRGFWQPLAWLSLMLDAQLFGAKAGGYHFTSLAIHAATTVLLFLVLRRLTGTTWRSAFVAALFGLHPLHVESVAWVSERKDVLSAFFWVLAMGLYGKYVELRESKVEARGSRVGKEEGKGEGRESRAMGESKVESRVSSAEAGGMTGEGRAAGRYYVAALIVFVLGLMSKSMVVTLPIILLLMDWWPLRRIDLSKLAEQRSTLVQLLREKAPYFLLALIFGVATIFAQKATGAVQDTDNYPILIRAVNASYAYLIYLFQMVWPASLAAFYSYPRSFPAMEVIGAIALLGGITAVALLAWKRRPYVAFGWCWYVVTLLPVIGLLQVGSQGHADRYTYIPLIGIFVALTWGVWELTQRVPNQRTMLATTAAVATVLCVVLTRIQIGYWKDSETLFAHALQVTEHNELAHNNYGTAVFRKGRADEALLHFKEAVRLKPRYVVARANLGTALMAKGRQDEAITELREAIRMSPRYAGAYRNLGTALGQKGRLDEAIPQFQKSLSLEPNDAEAHYDYGVALLEKGRLDEAIAQYREAVRLKSNYPEARANLGSALMMKGGNLDEAIVHLTLSIKFGGTFPVAYRNLGTALAQRGRLDEALPNLQKATLLAPNDVDAHYNFGVALLQKGYLDEGIAQFRAVLKLNPGHGAAQTNLDVALKAKGGGGVIQQLKPQQ